MPSSRKKPILLALVLILLASAAGLEIGARLIDRWRGEAWDAEVTRAYLADVCDQLSRRAYIPGGSQDEARAKDRAGTVALHPYTGWEHLATQVLMAESSDYFFSPEAERNYDIVIFGGSVAESFGENGKARLVEVLRQDPAFRDREVRVHNYGCPAFKQPQQLMFLSYALALGHKPDAVIELDGFNEAALAWSNGHSGANPAFPYLPGWGNATNGLRLDWELTERLHRVSQRQDEARSFGEWCLRSNLWRSCVLAHVEKSHLEKLRGAYADAFKEMLAYLKSRPQDLEVKGPRFANEDEAIAHACVSVWEECSRSMHGLCAERGITYLHVLQPTLHDDGSKPLTEK
jgi:hypothetical protein